MQYALALAGLVACAAALPTSAVALTERATCPTDLNGAFTAPNLIVPVDGANPDRAAGTQYVATISNTKDTLFQFSLPSSYAGKTCSLILLLPSSPNVENFAGDGQFHTVLLDDQVTNSTTWNTKGPVETDHGSVTVALGHSYTLATFNCPAGYPLTYQVASTLGNSALTFFETTGNPATGLYVRQC